MLSERQVSPFNGAARSVLLLGLEGASLVMGLALLALGESSVELVLRNTLPPPGRSLFALAVLAGGLLVALVALASFWRGPELSWRAARRLSHLAAPLIPLAVAPLLFRPFWAQRTTLYLVCLAAFGLLLERCLRLCFAEARLGERAAQLLRVESWSRWAPAVVVCAAALYAAWASYLTILNHHRFLTGAYDLGIYDNLMYSALKGHPFQSSVLFGERGGNSLCTHAEYGMLLFLPFYALRPSAEALLVIQALMFGGAAIPLFYFAASQLPRWQAAVVALAYLLFAPLHGAQFYDFHWLPLAMFFHFLLYWALCRGKSWVIALTLLVLFALREDTAPGLAVLGLALMLSGARARLGALIAGVSCVWFALNKFVIMPSLGSWWFDLLYKDLIAPGEHGGGSIFKTLLINPLYVLGTLLSEAKFAYLLHLLAPLAFLPLRRPLFALFLIPGALFTLLTSDYGAATSIRYQYPSHWIPYLFLATVLSLRLLRDVSPRNALAALATLCATVTFHSAVFGAALNPSSFLVVGKPLAFSLTAEERESYAELQRVLALIPKDASVTATDFEAPHLSNRVKLYAVGQDVSAGEYLLVHVRSLHLGATRDNVMKLLGEYPYGLVTRVPGRIYLFKKGVTSPDTHLAIRELRRAR